MQAELGGLKYHERNFTPVNVNLPPPPPPGLLRRRRGLALEFVVSRSKKMPFPKEMFLINTILENRKGKTNYCETFLISKGLFTWREGTPANRATQQEGLTPGE